MKECEVDRRTRQEKLLVIHISIESDRPGDGGGEGGPVQEALKR